MKGEIKKYRETLGDVDVVQPGRLKSLALRGLTGADEATLIGGFVTRGSGNKRIIMQSAGPTLRDFGVPNTLPRSNIRLFDSQAQELAFNDAWRTIPKPVKMKCPQ